MMKLDKQYKELFSTIETIHNFTALLYQNRENLINIYCDIQYSIFDVPEELEDRFKEDLKDEIEELLLQIKYVKKLIDSNKFGYESKLLSYEEHVDKEEYYKISELIYRQTDFLAELKVDFKEALFRSESEEKENETEVKLLKYTMNFIDQLDEAAANLSVELEVFLEEYFLENTEDDSFYDEKETVN